MDCLFCKIIEGEISACKVYEDNSTVAFLDINPLTDGHTIVMPKVHCEEFYQLDSDEYVSLMSVVKKIAKAIKELYNPFRVGMIVYGFDVAHAHIHLYQNTGKEVSMHQVADYPKEKLEQESEKLNKFLVNN